MDKLLELDERFPATGEPTVVLLATQVHGRWCREKVASPAFDYLKAVEPRDGHTFVLVNALGAYETYDDNRNGDGFPARPYRVGEAPRCGHKGCDPGRDGWIADGETLVHHYKTFETHGGIYKHHVNKDPAKSRGRIVAAIWHDRMQRVELVLDIVNARDQELVDRIGAGEFPAVSMGCHVRWDVCSICGHRAPTRKEYCEHARWKMRQVDRATGEKACVLNPSPRFFDISFVFRPADPTGYMLKKVAEAAPLVVGSAELGEKLADHEAKKAQVRKLSDLQKVVGGGVVEAARPRPELDAVRRFRDAELRPAVRRMPLAGERELDAMAPHSLSEVASTLAAKNAALTTGELVRLFVRKTAGLRPSRAELARVAALQPVVREVLAQHPAVAAKLAGFLELDDRHVRPALAARLGAWLDKRAGLGDYLRQGLHEPGRDLDGAPFGPGYAYNAAEPARTDLLTVTDPHTGRTYQTTRGAAMAAHNTDARAALAGGALLGGLYYLGLGAAGVPHGLLRGAVAAPLGYATSKALLHGAYRNPSYLTDQGLPVSGGTEFVKASAAGFGPAGLLVKLALDYAEHVGEGPAMDDALRREIAGHSPRLAAWLHDGASPAAKAAALVADLELPPGGPADPPDLDLARLADRLGGLVVG